MKAKRVITIVACVIMIFSMAACGNNNSEKTEAKTSASSETVTNSGKNAQIPDPWTKCSDMEEAEKNAGFSFDVPDTVEGYKIGQIQNMDQEMIEVIYEKTDDANNSDDLDDVIYIRKGSGTDDISGDYNSYSESKQVTIDFYNVTMKGANGTVSLATWTDGEFSYAVSTPEMSEEFVTAIIQQMK